MSTPSIDATQLPYFLSPETDLYCAGQPTALAIKQLAEQKFTHIINLRPDAEMQGFDEQACVLENHMLYSQLPINGPDDISFENAQKLQQLMNKTAGLVLVHCASANRVGALLALNASKIKKLSLEEAISYGRQAGLTKLEDKVRALLQNS